MEANTCYLCGTEKSSVEHVPAKCFFPKDPALRKNLMTVPSCTTHNECTSKDDEYVRNVICMSIGTNAIAFKQFIDKVQRSFIHSPALSDMTFHNKKTVYVGIEKNNIQRTFSFEINRERFDRVMKKMGYALYYHEFEKIWNRGLIIATDSLVDSDMQQDELGQLIQCAKKMIKIPTFDGSNPKVFQYKFIEIDDDDTILWMRFYEGFDVFVYPNTSTSQPDDISI